MNAILGKMGGNFLVAAFVPALAFASLALFVFGPIIPTAVVGQLQKTVMPLDEPFLLLLMVTVVIGFSLYSLNTTVYKIIEGYFFLNRFPAFGKARNKRVKRYYLKVRLLEKLYDHLLEQGEDRDLTEKVKNELYRQSATYQRNYPSDMGVLLPTRFGNAFRAMEIYPRQRYKMDAVLLWPRLLHVIPDAYHGKLDESNNRLAFLINCFILSLGTAVLSGLAAGYQLLMFHLAQKGVPKLLYFIDIVQDDVDKYQQNAYLYLAGIVIMMILSFAFYRAAIPIVVQYGELVKSAFDLFRFALIDALKLKRPTDYDSETTMWENLSMFFGHGLLGEEIDTVPFAYALANQNSEERDEALPADFTGEE
jgi:hypothetical protein